MCKLQGDKQKKKTFEEEDPRESLFDDIEESLPEAAITERTRLPAQGLSRIRDPAEKGTESVDRNEEGKEWWREALMAEEWSEIMVEMRRWLVFSPESV